MKTPEHIEQLRREATRHAASEVEARLEDQFMTCGVFEAGLEMPRDDLWGDVPEHMRQEVMVEVESRLRDAGWSIEETGDRFNVKPLKRKR